MRNKTVAYLCMCGAAAWLTACEGKKPEQRKEVSVARPAAEPAAPPARPPKPAPVTAAPAAIDTARVLARALGSRMQGFQIESTTQGNLNADKLPDFVVVLRATKPEDEGSGVPGAFRRRVALVLSRGYPRLELATCNDKIIECTDCGGMGVGDPHQGVTIRYPYLIFESLYGAWTKNAIAVTFKHSRRQHRWLLHEVYINTYSPSDHNHDGEPDSEEEVLTARNFGRVTFARADGPSFMLH